MVRGDREHSGLKKEVAQLKAMVRCGLKSMMGCREQWALGES